MISRLSDLLRITPDVRRGGALKEETEFLQKYLDIEQTRFQDRLRVNVSIDPDAPDGEVPCMILQPLVENDRHGIAGRYAATTSISAGSRAHGRRIGRAVVDAGARQRRRPPVRTLKRSAPASGFNTRARPIVSRAARLEFSDRDGGTPC